MSLRVLSVASSPPLLLRTGWRAFHASFLGGDAPERESLRPRSVSEYQDARVAVERRKWRLFTVGTCVRRLLSCSSAGGGFWAPPAPPGTLHSLILPAGSSRPRRSSPLALAPSSPCRTGMACRALASTRSLGCRQASPPPPTLSLARLRRRRRRRSSEPSGGTATRTALFRSVNPCLRCGSSSIFCYLLYRYRPALLSSLFNRFKDYIRETNAFSCFFRLKRSF